jgi:spermidine/putrescine transport system ATP-binding protein
LEQAPAQERRAVIELRHIHVSFDGTAALSDLNLSIYDGEFVTLLGPSGCGKTTTLRLIGGFLEPNEGDVLLDGVRCNTTPPHKRRVNTIFQRYALFPHLNVYKNVAFGLKLLKLPKTEVETRVESLLKTVNLIGFAQRSVDSLSGGQQQRVAIARALAVRPKVLLLDEPLGALDLKLRKDMQIELKTIQKQLGITFVYVTHDQEEALSMSDRVVVMNEGKIQQIGSPKDIYDEPSNAFVADFMGESNILDGVMQRDFLVRFAGRGFACVDKGFSPGERVDVVLRPEDIDLVAPGEGQLQGVITQQTFMGVHYEFIVDIGGYKWMIQSTDYLPPGSKVGVRIKPEEIHVMRKSKYSELVGDYSSYSDEFEELSNPDTASGISGETDTDTDAS